MNGITKRKSIGNIPEPSSKRTKVIPTVNLPRCGHPNGVKPLGNLYFSQRQEIRTLGLGLLSPLPDELILEIFENFDPVMLCCMALVSKTMYIFAGIDVMWKPFCIEHFKGDFLFQGTWKKTFAFKKYDYLIPDTVPAINVEGLFSDRLFQNWYCAQVDPYTWARKETIDRRSNLSVEEFIQEYEIPNKPVIITDIVPNWPASKWTRDNLIQQYGNIPFKTDYDQTEMKLADYLLYCEKVIEERPIYLFDNTFAERAPSMDRAYEIPKYFKFDYFELLNEFPSERPSYRWLLVGPPRAGSTFHKDPNFTSAWHGLIIGKKKWIMYPPDFVPYGVFPSPDGQDVTAPETMVQWFMDFYNQKTPVKPYECILKAGEMIFIPSAWWHSVLNLEESVAITQNYVSKCNIKSVYQFLRGKKNKKLFDLFTSKLEQHHPDLAEDLKKDIKQPQETILWESFVGDAENDANWTLNL